MSTKTQTKQTATVRQKAPEQYCIMCGHKTNDLVEHYSQEIETVKEGFALYSKNAHKEMAALQAHADKLAEALRDIRDCALYPAQVNGDLANRIYNVANAALAAYEEAK